MIARALALLALVAGCSDPPLKIIYQVNETGGGQTCGTTSCMAVPLQCESVLHLRILSPSNPMLPHVVICREVDLNEGKNLCSIGSIDLEPGTTLPRETLEVQVTVWPKDAVANPDGTFDCARMPVDFDAVDGFPTNIGPAFGGRAFYQPGDSETRVTLGCTDVASVNSCSGVDLVNVTATAMDFGNLPTVVDKETADDLFVGIGTASGQGILVELLERPKGGDVIWNAAIPATEPAIDFKGKACVQVIEDDAQVTGSLRCKVVAPGQTTINLAGVRVLTETLDQMLEALGLDREFPPAGLTVGRIVNTLGTPITGVTVTSEEGTIEYLNAAQNGIEVGATATTSSGIFFSRDAPYGTVFSIPQNFGLETNAVGGRVANKLTVVVFDPLDPLPE